MTEYYRVGDIVNTHGIKGEVRVQSVTSYPEERYQGGQTLTWLDQAGEQALDLVVQCHRLHKNFHLLTFEGYSNINEVEAFVGGSLNIEASQVNDADFDQGVFYQHDIVGLKVVDEAGNDLGQVKEIIETPANDVWVVDRPGQKDLLLPFIDSVILDLDFDRREITVHILEGLDD